MVLETPLDVAVLDIEFSPGVNGAGGVVQGIGLAAACGGLWSIGVARILAFDAEETVFHKNVFRNAVGAVIVRVPPVISRVPFCGIQGGTFEFILKDVIPPFQ